MGTKKVRKAVIPAAGLGTRFLPATKCIPKEMIPVLDIPMIQLIVQEAVAAGCEDVVIITARNKDAIQNHFDLNYELDDTLDKRSKMELLELSRATANLCNVITIRQKNPMGLGHAVLTAAPVIGDEPFAVLLPDEWIDSVIPCTRQLSQIYEETAQSVVAVMQVPRSEVSKYGIVQGQSVRNRLIKVESLVEKPLPDAAPSTLALPGRYVFSPEIFDCIRQTKPGKGGEIQLTDAMQILAQKFGLYAYEFEGDRYDTGDRLGYLDATLTLAMRRPELKAGVRALIKKHLEKI